MAKRGLINVDGGGKALPVGINKLVLHPAYTALLNSGNPLPVGRETEADIGGRYMSQMVLLRDQQRVIVRTPYPPPIQTMRDDFRPLTIPFDEAIGEE